MKKILIILIITIAPFCAVAQDNIYTKDQKIIPCKVINVDTATVQYKKWDNINGPTYTISKNTLLLIRYENGTSDFFNNPQASTPPPKQADTQSYTPPPTKMTKKSVKKVNSDKQTAPIVANQRRFGIMWDIYLGTDFSSFMALGLNWERRFGNGSGGDSYLGYYVSAEGAFAISQGNPEDADGQSALIYNTAGFTIGGLNPGNSISFKTGLGVDYMSGSLLAECQLSYNYNHFFAGFKTFYFGDSGYFYPEALIGCRF